MWKQKKMNEKKKAHEGEKEKEVGELQNEAVIKGRGRDTN